MNTLYDYEQNISHLNTQHIDGTQETCSDDIMLRRTDNTRKDRISIQNDLNVGRPDSSNDIKFKRDKCKVLPHVPQINHTSIESEAEVHVNKIGDLS